ncbi:MAG TPA: hypothetical protein VES88_10275 [Gemmatimonadaceae bacterium]|nr:hypothetical protein [Gemmatimonadaceae bacterium]
MKRIVIAVLLLAGCETNEPSERYGFVALLGRDTVSVESVTRRGTQHPWRSLRSPFVRLTPGAAHW